MLTFINIKTKKGFLILFTICKIFFCINIIGRLDSVIDRHTHLTDTKLDLPIRKIGMPIIIILFTCLI